MVDFVLVCQQMVISGAVATYYFTRDKTALVSPIYTSFYNLMRYHLGSAVYGSIIFLVTAQNNYFVHVCCCSRLKNSLQYPTPKGLIVTAICGTPLCQSSVRGATLVDSNFLSAVAKSSAGTFVFSTMQLLVFNITAIIGFFMIHSVQSVLIGAVFALVCAHCIFVVFQIAVDTLFICYCEDYCLNNGINEPFYATAELRQKVKEVQDFTKSIEGKGCVC
nr:PREDICTED: choline transporter-like protein 1 [Tribolium castaneum]|eukprot:XP_008198986.2 PREDICTED: choline transporter-like protein 1 [Tribolium castaneum]